MATATQVQAQQCVCCTKVRVLDEHYTWSHWQESNRVPQEVRDNAKMVVCEHCQKHYQPKKVR